MRGGGDKDSERGNGDARPDVSDQDLDQLTCLYRLERLEVPEAQITDAGLARLRGWKNLLELDLRGNAISDTGLVHLRGLHQLERLNLSPTEITDAGFIHLPALASLRQLDFGSTRATGTELKHLAGSASLKQCGDSGSNRALLSVANASTFNELRHLEEWHGRIVQRGSAGLSEDTVELDGHPKLRIVVLENRCVRGEAWAPRHHIQTLTKRVLTHEIRRRCGKRIERHVLATACPFEIGVNLEHLFTRMHHLDDAACFDSCAPRRACS